MIYEPSSGHSHFLKIDLRGDNVQSFKAKWDVTIISMRKQANEESDSFEQVRFYTT